MPSRANPLDILRSGVAEWNAWRASGPLLEVDLRGADLRGADLRGADLWYGRLQGARLDGALLAGATLHRVDLTAASLRGANMFGVKMRASIVERCSLVGSCLAEADLTLTRFIESDLESTVFTDAVLMGVGFERCNPEAALGLEGDAGWRVLEAEGEDDPETPFGIDRRTPSIVDGLRGAG